MIVRMMIGFIVLMSNGRCYEAATLRIGRLSGDLNYLYMCKSYKLIPKFLKFKLVNPGLLNTRSYCKCQNLLSKEEIQSKKYKIKCDSTLQNSLHNELINVLPPGVLKKLNGYLSTLQAQENRAKYRIHCRKVDNLLSIQYAQQQQREYVHESVMMIVSMRMKINRM